MSYPRLLKPHLLIVILLLIGPLVNRQVSALDCYQCGQYNEGVGSITPCLIYSEPLEKEHLKSCPRASDKFCIKYVSELSVVRDCVAECKEKDAWETRTFCCTTDGCNNATGLSAMPILGLLSLVAVVAMSTASLSAPTSSFVIVPSRLSSLPQ